MTENAKNALPLKKTCFYFAPTSFCFALPLKISSSCSNRFYVSLFYDSNIYFSFSLRALYVLYPKKIKKLKYHNKLYLLLFCNVPAALLYNIIPLFQYDIATTFPVARSSVHFDFTDLR